MSQLSSPDFRLVLVNIHIAVPKKSRPFALVGLGQARIVILHSNDWRMIGEILPYLCNPCYEGQSAEGSPVKGDVNVRGSATELACRRSEVGGRLVRFF